MFTTTSAMALFSTLSSLAASAVIVGPRDSIPIPPECDVIPAWEIASFSWFNSSQNLDCVSQNNVPNVCFNSTSSGLVACDSGLTACDVCGVSGCSTGLPLQPAGYGPPDNVSISIPSVEGYSQCYESNPQSIRRHEVGAGTVLCAGVAYHLEFDGNSNTDTSTGHIDFEPITSWDCTNGSTITASGSLAFAMDCTRDAQNNATCVFAASDDGDGPVVIPVTAFTIHDPSS